MKRAEKFQTLIWSGSRSKVPSDQAELDSLKMLRCQFGCIYYLKTMLQAPWQCWRWVCLHAARQRFPHVGQEVMMILHQIDYALVQEVEATVSLATCLKPHSALSRPPGGSTTRHGLSILLLNLCTCCAKCYGKIHLIIIMPIFYNSWLHNIHFTQSNRQESVNFQSNPSLSITLSSNSVLPQVFMEAQSLIIMKAVNKWLITTFWTSRKDRMFFFFNNQWHKTAPLQSSTSLLECRVKQG